jgi:hypothetical protein
LEPEKSGAEADWILDAAAEFGLARETRAKPASTMTYKGKQSVNSKIRAPCANAGVSYPKLARPEVDYGN